MTTEVIVGLRVAAAQADDLSDFVRREASTDWAGASADAYAQLVKAVGRRAEADSLTLRAAVSAFETFATAAAHDADLARAAVDLRARLAHLGPQLVAAEAGGRDAIDPGDEALKRCPRGGPAVAVRRWWTTSPKARGAAVLVVAPGLIGRLDGLPSAVRSAGNRLALSRDVLAGNWRRDRDLLSTNDQARLRTSQETELALAALEDRGLTAELFLYDPAAFQDDGRIAVVAGALDEADHVGVLVPGFGTDAAQIVTVASELANWPRRRSSGPVRLDCGDGLDWVRRTRQLHALRHRSGRHRRRHRGGGGRCRR